MTHHAVFTTQEQADLVAIAQFYLDEIDLHGDMIDPVSLRRKALAEHVIAQGQNNVVVRLETSALDIPL